VKIANQPVSTPAAGSVLDRGLNQLEQVADRALGGLTDLGQGFSSLFSQATAAGEQGAQATTNRIPVATSDPAMANNAEHARKIAAGIAARTAAEAAKENSAGQENIKKDTAKPAAAQVEATGAGGNIQQEILSTLGLNFTGSEGLDTRDITSASSLDALQGAFLSSLQANLFSSKTRAAETPDDSNKGPSAVEAEQGSEQTSLMDTLSKYTFGENGLELTDAFDSVNILQHIPVVSGIYQQVTEQDMSAVAKLTGGFLYGGPLGLAVSAADLTLEGITGNSINSTVINFDYQGLFDGITDGLLGSNASQTAVAKAAEVPATALSTAGLSSSVLAQLPQFTRPADAG